MGNPLKHLIEQPLRGLRFDRRTIDGLKFDLRRAWTRLRHHRRRIAPAERRLQLGAGRRAVPGRLNCDITGSDYDVDLASPPLPFPDGHFTDIVSQHVVEHLEFDPTVIDLLHDCFRMLAPGGRIWISTPDLEKVVAAYVADRCESIDRGQKRHWPHADAPGFPVQHRINFYFHQWGEHRNLMDFDLLAWALRDAGFVDVRRGDEAAFLADYPDFPPRRDDRDSLYITARKPERDAG